MKLKQSFISYVTDKEAMLVPGGDAGFSGLVRGNRTFEAILELLKNSTTEETIIETLVNRYDASEALVARDVHRALSELRRIGALDED